MADALASGASVRKDVGVQVPPRAPHLISLIESTRFSLYIYCEYPNLSMARRYLAI